MLYHLLYLSSATVPFDSEALAKLLATARRKNSGVDVSGMLLHADGNFIQYLEGEENAVREVFNRINRDPRHSGVLVVSEGPEDERVFPSWSMGFRALTPDEQRNLGEIELSRQALRDRLGANAPVILKTMMARFYEVTHPLSGEILAAE